MHREDTGPNLENSSHHIHHRHACARKTPTEVPMRAMVKKSEPQCPSQPAWAEPNPSPKRNSMPLGQSARCRISLTSHHQFHAFIYTDDFRVQFVNTSLGSGFRPEPYLAHLSDSFSPFFPRPLCWSCAISDLSARAIQSCHSAPSSVSRSPSPVSSPRQLRSPADLH